MYALGSDPLATGFQCLRQHGSWPGSSCSPCRKGAETGMGFRGFNQPLNPKPLNPKTLNPQILTPINPKPLTLNPSGGVKSSASHAHAGLQARFPIPSGSARSKGGEARGSGFRVSGGAVRWAPRPSEAAPGKFRVLGFRGLGF